MFTFLIINFELFDRAVKTIKKAARTYIRGYIII